MAHMGTDNNCQPPRGMVNCATHVLVMIDSAISIATPPYQRQALAHRIRDSLIHDLDFPVSTTMVDVEEMLHRVPKSILDIEIHREILRGRQLASTMKARGTEAGSMDHGNAAYDPPHTNLIRKEMDPAALPGDRHIRLPPEMPGPRSHQLTRLISNVLGDAIAAQSVDPRKRFFDMFAGNTFLLHDHRPGDVAHYSKMTLAERRSISKSYQSMTNAKVEGAASPILFRILGLGVPDQMKNEIWQHMQQIERCGRDDPKYREWFETLCSFPFGVGADPDNAISKLRIAMEADEVAARPEVASYLGKCREKLDAVVYGQPGIKNCIMEIVAARLSNAESRMGSILGIQGPPGVGKTRIAVQGLAAALDMPCEIITLGSESDSMLLKGSFYAYEGSRCGGVASALIRAKSQSCILYFDELDKVCASRHGDEVASCLIHLTDPEHNACFRDRYIGNVDIDVSACVIVFSFNDASKISPVLMDRLQVVKMQEYGRDDKITIASDYLLPTIMKDVGMASVEPMSTELIGDLVDAFSPENGGLRATKHALERACLKFNVMRVQDPLEDAQEQWRAVYETMLEDKSLNALDCHDSLERNMYI